MAKKPGASRSSWALLYPALASISMSGILGEVILQFLKRSCHPAVCKHGQQSWPDAGALPRTAASATATGDVSRMSLQCISYQNSFKPGNGVSLGRSCSILSRAFRVLFTWRCARERFLPGHTPHLPKLASWQQRPPLSRFSPRSGSAQTLRWPPLCRLIQPGLKHDGRRRPPSNRRRGESRRHPA